MADFLQPDGKVPIPYPLEGALDEVEARNREQVRMACDELRQQVALCDLPEDVRSIVERVRAPASVREE